MYWKNKWHSALIWTLLFGGLCVVSVPVRAEETMTGSALKITAVEVSTDTAEYAQDHEGWVNMDTTFTVTVHTEVEVLPETQPDGLESPDESSGSPAESPEPPEEAKASVIAACAQNDESWEDACILDGIQEGDLWIFSFQETDEIFEGIYRFAVYDSLGNGKEESEETPIVVEFKKDKIPPTLDGLEVEYHTDTGMDSGRHDFSGKEEDENKILFARNEVEAILYVKDDLSGICSTECFYGGKTYVAVPGDIPEADEEYGTVPLKVTLKGDQKDTLKVSKMVDVAGNETIPEQPLTGDELLLIDSMAPEISTDSGDYVSEASGKRFYQGSKEKTGEEVILTFTERYFPEQLDAEGDPVKPEIRICRNGVWSEEPEHFAEWIRWGDYDADSGEIKAVITLPYETEKGGGETEYQIRAFYEDGSGNQLTWKAGEEDHFGALTGEQGYQSGIFVLDNRPPQLLSYEISGEVVGQNGSVGRYRNQEDTDDVTFQIIIRDNPVFWRREAVDLLVIDTRSRTVLVSNAPERLGGTKLHGLRWSDQEDLHTAVFGFDGEEHVSSRYEVRISYKDLAGNVLAAEDHVPVHTDDPKEGVYAGTSFVLDHVPPVFQISYNEAFQNVDGTAYYGKKQERIVGKISFEEEYPMTEECMEESGKAESPEAGKAEDQPGGLECRINGEKAALSWSRDGNVYTGIFCMEKDGDYLVSVSGQDEAGNRMTAGILVQHGEVTNGSYTSSRMVLDTAAPAVMAACSSEPVDVCEERKYFQEDTTLQIRIADQNIGCGDLKAVLEKMEVTDITGEKIENSSAELYVKELDGQDIVRGKWEVEIPIDTDGNYAIPVGFTDLAGNRAVLSRTELITKDGERPERLLLMHTPDNSVNYKPFGYLFSGQAIALQAEAKDRISGIHRIRYTITDENGKAEVIEDLCPPQEIHTYELKLPKTGNDFKGTVLTEAYDWCGNCVGQICSYVIESEEMHRSCGRIWLTERTGPSRTKGKEDYWNTDVKLRLSIEDMYSGISSYRYKIGNASEEEVDFREQAGRVPDRDGQTEVTEEVSLDLVLEAALNNENDIKVYAEYTDNAGHTERIEKTYHVDTTVPEISVEYDRNEPVQGHYYNQSRTADIVIRERNFRAEDVEFLITGSDDAMPKIGEWTVSGAGDEMKHSCQVIFSEDGDYTFTVAFEDMAGNRAVYDRVDEFTIDRTEPELTVIYDNDERMNEHYYRQSRTAAIQVQERNFDPALLEVKIASDAAAVPNLSGWHSEGDLHTAFVAFEEDGEYTMEITGKDKAGNSMETYKEEPFVIDRIGPELTVLGVEDQSANNGIVMPVVQCRDQNLNKSEVEIQLTGYRNGLQELTVSSADFPDGVELTLPDMARVRELDDMYTLKATACDLAGNQSEVNIMYSINRFGSVYTFNDQTEQLLGEQGKYYTKEAPDLVITETNVDTLEFREITCSLNGNLQTLEEGKDYVVHMSGEEAGWKQYTYQIDRQNFEEEGVYALTIYSKDRASNISDNHTKGKKIEFAVDRTAPSILVSGVEDKGQYRDNSREITLDIQDNVRLREVQIIVDGKKRIYTEAELEEMNDKITILADSANHWQTFQAIAVDAAGNRQKTKTMDFLVTPNLLVQFFLNISLFSSALTILLILLLCTISYTCRNII